MKMIAVGDNVTDCYPDMNVYYPGGNCVNVAVNCKRDGFEEVSYIGIISTDEHAEHITHALDCEGIDYSRSRRVLAPTSCPEVRITDDGDRIFIGGNRDSCQSVLKLSLTSDDLLFIKQHDICHISCYSNMEHCLKQISKVCPISFDFSSDFGFRSESYLKETAPYIDIAFFSGADMNRSEIEEFSRKVSSFGPKTVVITQGEKGSTTLFEGDFHSFGIYPVENMADAMGAGDSFIGGFLTAYCQKKSIDEIMSFAAKKASDTCQISGAFGYPHPLL